MKELIKKVLRETHQGTYHREGDVEEWRINPYEVETDNYKELMDRRLITYQIQLSRN